MRMICKMFNFIIMMDLGARRRLRRVVRVRVVIITIVGLVSPRSICETKPTRSSNITSVTSRARFCSHDLRSSTLPQSLLVLHASAPASRPWYARGSPRLGLNGRLLDRCGGVCFAAIGSVIHDGETRATLKLLLNVLARTCAR